MANDEIPFPWDIEERHIPARTDYVLFLPWGQRILDSREKAMEMLAEEVKLYTGKLSDIGNPESAADLIENHGEYATAANPPNLGEGWK